MLSEPPHAFPSGRPSTAGSSRLSFAYAGRRSIDEIAAGRRNVKWPGSFSRAMMASRSPQRFFRFFSTS